MNNYKDITKKYLIEKKKRTLLTIFGIIMSVALITGVGTIIVSVKEGFINQTKKTEGRFHAKLEGISKTSFKELKNNVNLSAVGSTQEIGYAPLAKTNKNEKDRFGTDMPYRYLSLNSYDKEAFKMIPIKIIEGRLPEKEDEIMLDKLSLKYLSNKKIGDEIELDYGERIEVGKTKEEITIEEYKKQGSKTFKIVGFSKPRINWAGDLIHNAYTGFSNKENESSNYAAYIEFKDIKDAHSQFESIKKEIPNKEGIYNDRLLRLSAEGISDTFNKSIWLMLIFIVSIIVISTIAVIYNSFNISVIERIEQFGLLRALGATPNQIKNIVYREALIMGLISIPLGILSGLLAMQIVFSVISKFLFKSSVFEFTNIVIDPVVIMISVGISFVTIFLSAIIPAKKSASISPIDALRGENLQKLDVKQVKGSKLIRRIFGIEGELAFKNLSRNKKRVRITIFSMVISIVVFITFSVFSTINKRMMDDYSKNLGDFNISGQFKDEDTFKSLLYSNEDIEKVFYSSLLQTDYKIPKDKVDANFLRAAESYLRVEEDNQDIEIGAGNIYSLLDENIKDLNSNLKSGKLDIDKLDQGGVILVSSSSYNDGKEQFFKNAYKYKAGDVIKLENFDGQYKELPIVAVIDEAKFNMKYNLNASINLITTEKNLEKLNKEFIKSDSYKDVYVYLKDSSNKDVFSQELEDIVNSENGFSYIDYSQVASENKKFDIMMNIFIYGFITIISLISSINIINTISTNIMLRKKEIGVIRAIGLSKSGVKKMIVLESTFYGIFASIIGSIVSVGLTIILYILFNGVTRVTYVFPIYNILIASAASILIAIFSGKYPLKRINDDIIVETIRDDN